MSIDAGSNFVLQFTSIGAVRAQARANDVGRAVEGVTRRMRQARTSFGQVAGATTALGRVFGANLGAHAVGGALAGRATSALGFDLQRELEPLGRRMSQLSESITGLVGTVGLGFLLQRMQQGVDPVQRFNRRIAAIERRAVQQTSRVRLRRERIAEVQAVALQGTAAERSARRQQISRDRRMRREGHTLARAGAGAAAGARTGGMLGPLGAMIGTVVGFVAVGVLAQVAGRMVGGLVQDAFGTQRAMTDREQRIREQQLEAMQVRARIMPGNQGESMQRIRQQLEDERRADTTRLVLEGGFGERLRAAARTAGDFLADDPDRITDIRSIVRLRSAVDRRMEQLEQRLEEIEQQRQEQAAQLANAMRRANRL